MSPKKDPLGGGIVPLGGPVGVDDVEDGVEDEGENQKTVPRKRTPQHTAGPCTKAYLSGPFQSYVAMKKSIKVFLQKKIEKIKKSVGTEQQQTTT